MNRREPDEAGHESGLRMDQREFIDSFLRSGQSEIIVLRAGPGSGKSWVLGELAARYLAKDPSGRVLILTPPVLPEFFAERFRREHVPHILGSRLKFRELLDSGDGEMSWPFGAITVMSVDVARQADILESLEQLEWGLVIVDEAQYFSGLRANVVRKVGRQGTRIVMASAVEFDISKVCGPERREVVEWRLGGPDRVRLGAIVSELEFVLSTDEKRICDGVDALLGDPTSSPMESDSFVTVFARASESSPAALENSLRNLMSDGGVGSGTVLDPDNSSDEMVVKVAGERRLSQMPADYRDHLLDILHQIERLQTDSKLNALGDFLEGREIRKQNMRVCVLTAFASTAYYLGAGLEDRGLACLFLLGGVPAEEALDTVSSFEEGKGVLVASHAALKGFELAVTNLIFYEMPSAPTATRLILPRFQGLDEGDPLNIHVLVPASPQDGLVRKRLRLFRDEVSRWQSTLSHSQG